MSPSALALLLIAAPQGATLFEAEDPARDDRGRGDYVYPSRPAYPPHVFDLRRFEVRLDGDEVVFEVGFARPVRRPPEQARRTNAIEIQLDNGVFVKHVDIYVRTGDGEGVQAGLPGRNVALEDGWHRAVVITPRPFLLQSLLKRWPHADQVIVPAGVRAVGRTVIARVPQARFGKTSPARWRFAVAVSGALWENTFDTFPEAPDNFVPNALTMPVRTVADWRWFGGGDLEGGHPWVIDVLAPTPKMQFELLGAGRPGRPARLPWWPAR